MELFIEGISKAWSLIVSSRCRGAGGYAPFAENFLQCHVCQPLSSAFRPVVFLALSDFPGRRLVISLVNTGMGLPPVVVGLFVTLFLWRNGPLGFLEILYTPSAMVLAQAVIATPIVTGITVASIQNLPANLKLQVQALGATRVQTVWILIREARLPLLAAVMAGFGGVISEVGASIMVGGNIKGQTRVLTTATVMETGKGNFDVAIALSLILLVLAFSVNYLLTVIQQRERPR